MQKRWILFLLSILVSLLVFSANAFAATELASGSCGASASWSLDSDGVLKIVGSGAMDNYYSPKSTPWSAYKDEILSVAVSGGISNIGDYAFYNCKSLKEVEIADGVIGIGSEAFSACQKLVRLCIPRSIQNVGENAFANCDAIEAVYIADISSWCMIDFEYGFEGANPLQYTEKLYIGDTQITELVIPGGITAIKSWAFHGCACLTSVVISEGVTSLGECAFVGCTGLEQITFPSTLVNIGDYAFSSCKSLSTIAIPGKVKNIGNNAFYRCVNLSSIIIGSTEMSVSANAFKNCTSIKKVFYAGSEAEWNDLAISAGNEYLTGAEIFYNSTPTDYYCTVKCTVSPGGTVSVAKNVYTPGETVTVTATPYTGYVLTEICVDGASIEGNSFIVTGNHTVSAVFTKLPMAGGTERTRIGDIAVYTLSGAAQQTIPAGQCLVMVPVTNVQQTDSVTVLIASYTEAGQYRGMAWVSFEDLPVGVTVKATVPLDNSSGQITRIRAFVVGSIFDPAPLGSAVSFGAA